MNLPRRYVAASVVVLLGGALILATIVGRWGHVAYGLGVVVVAAGVAWVVALTIRRPAWRVGLSAGAVLVVAAGAVVAVTGLPQSAPRWGAADAKGLDDWSARTGDLMITGGTARDLGTGKAAWTQEGPDARPLLVDDELVVIGTRDGSIGVDPATGREIWRSAVSGRGIAHDEHTLVVAATDSDDHTEAVALDLVTGATVWQQTGRPVMECDFGPADRFSPAREQSHVLLVRDEEREGRAELLDLADGHTTIDEVDCSVTARIVGEVVLETDGRGLTGRSPADGTRLWSTPVQDPWNVNGSGSTVFTSGDRTGTTAIDVMTGERRRVDPPPGTVEVELATGVQRSPEVWALVDLGSAAALWNPGTGETVEVPDAVEVHIAGVDVSSGWMALSGTTRDLTGAESDQCWAVSQDGQVSAPIPGPNCYVSEGLLRNQRAVYPVRQTMRG